jgi:hypothetical protein
MSWEVMVVLLMVAVPVLWSLASPGTAAPPRLPPPVVREAEALPHETAWDDEEAIVRAERPAPVLEELEGPQVLSLEPLDARPALYEAEPDRAGEHARFHRRVAAPEAREEAAPPFLDAGGLRRAMLTAEVLGAPRSLRPL